LEKSWQLVKTIRLLARIVDSSSKKRSRLFIRTHNEPLTVAAMRVCNPDRSNRRSHPPGYAAWRFTQSWSHEVSALYFVTLRPEEIDWAGLRAAAVAIGIRRAARQAAHDLPPDEQERFIQRAMKRCSRQKWLAKAQQDKADAVVTSATALSANVRKGSDVLSEVLAEDSRATRIGLSAAVRKAAETLAKMAGSKVIKHAQAHRHVTASSSVLHGWDDKGNAVPFTLNVLNLGSFAMQVRKDDEGDNATP
jgi:hypothetical protein